MRDEARGAQVVQDMAELLGAGQRIERREHRAELERRVNGDNGSRAVRHEDGDAIAAAHAAARERGSKARRALVDLAVGVRPFLADERYLAGQPRGGLFEEVVQQHCLYASVNATHRTSASSASIVHMTPKDATLSARRAASPARA